MSKKMISVKKRTDQWKNETATKINIFQKHTTNLYGDRFIPRRILLKNCEKNLKFSVWRPRRDVFKLNLDDIHWRENTYIPTINNIMELHTERVFSLTDNLMKSAGMSPSRAEQFCKKSTRKDWPCHPRSKPFAYTDITFDLPYYDSNCEKILVDWSSNGQIVFSFGNDIVIWQSDVCKTMSFSVKYPRSLAYSPSGNFLAIGCMSVGFPVIEIWDVSCVNDFTAVSGKIFHSRNLEVLCIEWTSSGSQLVCGTSNGTMYTLSVPELNTLRKIRKHLLPITTLRFSPTMRYLASCDSEGNVMIYNWNICTVCVYVKSKQNFNVVFDWHPWTGVDLAISEKSPASIAVLHVPSRKIVAFYQQDGKNLEINSISFSKVTGELLVSTSSQDSGVCNDYKVLVMSSIDQVVDILKIPDGGARFLAWSPDGTRVATIGSDETLTMWKFCSDRRTNCFRRINGNKENDGVTSKYGEQFNKWCYLK